MAKNPIKHWDREKSSEIVDFIMENIIPAINALEQSKVTKTDFEDLKKLLMVIAGRTEENDSVVSAISELSAYQANCRQEDIIRAIGELSAYQANCRQEDILNAIYICSSKIDKIHSALIALAGKLNDDSAVVTGLSNDYESAVTDIIQ